MWLSFWFDNIHFALEFFGAVILFSLAWLAFDAFLIKKEFKTLARFLGFFFFALWLIVHSLNITQDFILFSAIIFYFLGLFFIFFNLYSERPPARPEIKIVLVLTVSSFLWQVNILATFLLGAVTIFAIKRYREEFLKTLKPFLIAFSLLTLASILAIFNERTEFKGLGWVAEHILKFGAFSFLALWAWQYLKARLKEELLLIFVAMGLFIAMLVTFTFSAALLRNMENEAQAQLVSNVKVLDYSLSRMKNEALFAAQVFAKDKDITDNLAKKNFVQLEKVVQQLLFEKPVTFLVITDESGEVILRAHAATAKGDNVKEERAAREALSGRPYATVEANAAEKFSIRGAAPIYDSKNNLLGALITGFIIDNAFTDQLKRATGLEATIYNRDTVQATTIFDPQGKTRNVGSRQTDQEVLQKVLKEGRGLVVKTTIFSRPYFAAYLPLENSEREVIGMLQASREQTGIAQTASAANRLTLLVTTIIVTIILMPAYLLAKKITEEI